MEEKLKLIKKTKLVCGELSCDQVSVYERKDKKVFDIHEFTPQGRNAMFIIVPHEEFYPGRKQSFETMEKAKKEAEDY